MSNVVSSPDFVTVATNVGVFLATVGTVIAAIWQAFKKIRGPGAATSDGQRIIGGMIMDNTTLLMWSESNRLVVDSNRDLEREIAELRFAVVQLKDAVK